jgi:hypothetical protein
MVVYLTEIMPVAVRTVGFSLAYSLATAIFGGNTPAIAQALFHETGNRAMAGVWLSFAAACGLVATFLAGRQGNQGKQGQGSALDPPRAERPLEPMTF